MCGWPLERKGFGVIWRSEECGHDGMDGPAFPK